MGFQDKKVGVLALQGAFAEHLPPLQRLGVTAVEVRLPRHLEGVAGLIIPGGESTTIGKLMEEAGLREPLLGLARSGLPVWGICAGMILLASQASELPFSPLGLIDMTVKRNAFGRQVDSFEVELPFPVLGQAPFPGVFIRAPFIESVGAGVEVLGRLSDGRVVAAQQGKFLATAFHPELTPDLRFHAYFLKLI